MAYVLSHTAAFIALLALVCAPGLVWDRLFFWRIGTLPERTFAGLVTGFTTWIVIAFVLCATHLLTRPIVATIAGVVAVVAFVVAIRWKWPAVGRDWPTIAV